MIAQRTKDALQAAKARGVVLGNPCLDLARNRAVFSLKADADRFAKNVGPIIREIQATGIASDRDIARSQSGFISRSRCRSCYACSHYMI